MARPRQTDQEIISVKLRKALLYTIVLLDDKDKTLNLHRVDSVFDLPAVDLSRPKYNFFDTGIKSVAKERATDVARVGKLFTEKLRHKSNRVKVKEILDHLSEQYPELTYKPLVKEGWKNKKGQQRFQLRVSACVKSTMSALQLVEKYNVTEEELAWYRNSLDQWQSKYGFVESDEAEEKRLDRTLANQAEHSEDERKIKIDERELRGWDDEVITAKGRAYRRLCTLQEKFHSRLSVDGMPYAGQLDMSKGYLQTIAKEFDFSDEIWNGVMHDKMLKVAPEKISTLKKSGRSWKYKTVSASAKAIKHEVNAWLQGNMCKVPAKHYSEYKSGRYFVNAYLYEHYPELWRYKRSASTQAIVALCFEAETRVMRQARKLIECDSVKVMLKYDAMLLFSDKELDLQGMARYIKSETDYELKNK